MGRFQTVFPNHIKRNGSEWIQEKQLIDQNYTLCTLAYTYYIIDEYKEEEKEREKKNGLIACAIKSIQASRARI